MANARQRLYSVAAVVLSLGALVAVWYVAYSAGVNRGLQESYYCHMLHAESELSALDNLQKQDIVATRSNLETSLNVSVALLSGAYSLMNERTFQLSQETLLKIKKRREQHPWAGYDEEVRKRIQSALDAVHEQPPARP